MQGTQSHECTKGFHTFTETPSWKWIRMTTGVSEILGKKIFLEVEILDFPKSCWCPINFKYEKVFWK